VRTRLCKYIAIAMGHAISIILSIIVSYTQELKDINMDSIEVRFLPKKQTNKKTEPFHFRPHTVISFLHYSYHRDHGANGVIKNGAVSHPSSHIYTN